MNERIIVNNHYPGLDVVRVIAIAGIVLMHVFANGNYGLSGFLFEKVIGRQFYHSVYDGKCLWNVLRIL